MNSSVDNTKELTGGLTAEQIEQMKAQNGPLTLVSTTDASGEPLHFWFKNPDTKAISAFNKIVRNDEIVGLQVIFKNCLLNKNMEKYGDDGQTLLSISELMTKSLVKKRPATTSTF